MHHQLKSVHLCLQNCHLPSLVPSSFEFLKPDFPLTLNSTQLQRNYPLQKDHTPCVWQFTVTIKSVQRMFLFESVFRFGENRGLLIMLVQKKQNKTKTSRKRCFCCKPALNHVICMTVSHFFVYVEQMVIIAAMNHKHVFTSSLAELLVWIWTVE